MNVNLTYQGGISYSQYFDDFTIKVSGGGKKRVKVAFKENGNSNAYSSFSLPREKAVQLAHAILTASAGVEQPIEFVFQERLSSSAAAA
jgi:hypothetical protein